ncbi:MAG TPA: hypothetical protein VE093_08105 [Polyangiaceae bacterium]|nr:hypothetical protein [Polyangiaceae bacterium]
MSSTGTIGGPGNPNTPVAHDPTHDPASQASPASQTRGAPTHAPAWQVSVVQASLSAQGVPSAASGFEQTPVAGSHEPGAWH